jgi:hypothetical protein
MTARETLNARLGRDIGPLATMPRDLRTALYNLARVMNREWLRTRKETQ